MTNMPLNTQYVTNSTLVSPVKMEYALQMFAGIYGGFIGKSEYGDFKGAGWLLKIHKEV